jgi:DNA-binding NtrC family response regulator/ABC-type nitrate/sulfonate/bicarbonate transport system substrate-binding protein
MPVFTLPEAGALSVRAKALVFQDPESIALLHRIEQVARSHATVLITGETGTGKEIVARRVHALSPRAGKPFVAVNCGALSDALVESELFGHERGAFTGADVARPGWFETSNGGTLFLDEIGDLSLSAQVKLLRVLQEGEVVRLGSRRHVPVDVRLIAATNVELEAAVAAGRFRQDLYYRLNVATLALRPLRERPADVVPLAEHFLAQYAERLEVGRVRLAPDAIDGLLGHAWPGNIRELENVIHRALLVCRDQRVTRADLGLRDGRASRLPAPEARAENETALLDRALLELFEHNLPDLYQRIEERIMANAYRYSERNQLQTARLLSMSRNVVRTRLIQFGLIPGTLRTPLPPAPLAADRAAPGAAPPQGRRVPGVAPRRLRVAYQPWGRLPLLAASGALERATGLDVEWIEYVSGTQLVTAFEGDRLDIGMVGDGPSVLAQAARLPIVYLAAETLSPEREAIVVPAESPIQSVSDLRGRSVVVSRGSNANYLLLRALEEAQIDYDAVSIAYEPPDRAQAAFEGAHVDAWAIWDPYLDAAKRDHGARVVRDRRGLSDHTAYYIGSRALTERHPQWVRAFLHELDAVQIAPANESNLAIGRLTFPLGAHHMAALQAVADTFLRFELIDSPVAVSRARWSAAAQL